ncbi:YaiO family outer membrane beta-barrel protein [Alteriqipengyuania lutimaris]|uniref:YaiO family outer membrane beta-barrel protein n=1 Tax=Alteriqipengyuania lutimaris TaxID=1538146 RepID=A0A395LL33_9SPHN|nr:YaiO family outer membrane beta-barrel protein [Alteriqipengyuania lutimaris]MBB3033604.1 YaiO family outer membrane protein [Alteriqipengyuania lutimaris]RDS77399.1 YaiO family outer membrane beta-barrel protein [Alteriqipengyuania lutimaris]
MDRARRTFALILGILSMPLAAQEPDTPRAQRLDTAAQAYAGGDFERAREILLPLLAASPDDPDLLRRLAMVEAGDGRLDRAKERIDAATRLAPDDLDVALARAYILYWRGEVSAAQRAAAAISARDPDYPELDQLTAALARQEAGNGFRMRAISIGAGISDITTANGFSQTWNDQTLVAAFDVSGEDTITLGARREERAAIDTRLSARIDHRLADGFVYVAATAVPAPHFQERWSVGAGGELRATQTVTALIDLRAADYDTGTIAAVQPGLRLALDRDFALTGQAINIFGGDDGYRLGGSVRLDYGRERETSLFLIAASYPDAEADGLRQLRSVAAGVRVPVTDTLALNGVGSYENREDSYRRYAGTVTLTYRFEAR